MPHEELSRPLSHDGQHGLGETALQHAAHSNIEPKHHWGLPPFTEAALFYAFAIPSWALEIAAAAIGAFYHSWTIEFAVPMGLFLALHWAAWLQTVVQMLQRASWVRDEADLNDRRRYLYLAVRLNRLMLPTAIIAFATFVQAYVRRFSLGDLAYWLLFLLCFIWNTVFCVMNAYNNITWESDRLEFEENEQPFRIARLAIFGIPTEVVPNKVVDRLEDGGQKHDRF